MTEQTDMRVFVERLLDDEEDAWLSFKGGVEGFLKKDIKFNEILKRTSHPHEEFVDALIVHLKEDDKRRLKSCKSPEAFWEWLNRVEWTVLEKLTGFKRDSSRLEFTNEEPDEIGSRQIAFETAKEKLNQHVHHQEVMERLQVTRTNFAKLWKDDPQSAFIMFARFELEVSSRDVGMLLGIKANYVDVMVNRTRVKLRDEEEKML